MNTADRSLAMVDYALRRRFSFFDLRPRFDTPRFREYLTSRGADDGLVSKIVDRMAELNAEIAKDAKNLGPGFVIGHSFFCPPDGTICDEAWYKGVIEAEIAPLLHEFWFDAPQRANRLIDRLLA
jgi:hypothetical protein